MKIDGFKLKSYTTKIKPKKSLSEIEDFLTKFGATAIMKDIDSNKLVNVIAFKINNKMFKLPLNVEGVKVLLFSNNTKLNSEAKTNRAYMVACRVLREWVHAQLSLVASGQAEPEQVLLPYFYNGKETIYDLYNSGAFELEYKETNERLNN